VFSMILLAANRLLGDLFRRVSGISPDQVAGRT
jgi:hypothetical protein